MTPPVRLLLVDDHHDFLVSAASLPARPQLFSVGAVRSGEKALTLLNSFPVDLVPLAPEYRRRALAAGADGFIAKAEFTTALFPLIVTLFSEETR